jgi:hypothetical protein
LLEGEIGADGFTLPDVKPAAGGGLNEETPTMFCR